LLKRVWMTRRKAAWQGMLPAKPLSGIITRL